MRDARSSISFMGGRLIPLLFIIENEKLGFRKYRALSRCNHREKLAYLRKPNFSFLSPTDFPASISEESPG